MHIKVAWIMCGLVVCVWSFLLYNSGSSEGKNSFDDFLRGREDIVRDLGLILSWFCIDLGNILTEIWKFPYFSWFGYNMYPTLCKTM